MRLIRPFIFGKVLRGRRRNKVNVRRIYPCFGLCGNTVGDDSDGESNSGKGRSGAWRVADMETEDGRVSCTGDARRMEEEETWTDPGF